MEVEVEWGPQGQSPKRTAVEYHQWVETGGHERTKYANAETLLGTLITELCRAGAARAGIRSQVVKG
ncbi:hypothetical protein, partial [Paenibacillus terricola]|uniref:hypothetical protein n=1 Tax=Paenibacillus terricola TaxID=2763503 RepID=UPI001CD0FCA2